MFDEFQRSRLYIGYRYPAAIPRVTKMDNFLQERSANLHTIDATNTAVKSKVQRSQKRGRAFDEPPLIDVGGRRILHPVIPFSSNSRRGK